MRRFGNTRTFGIQMLGDRRVLAAVALLAALAAAIFGATDSVAAGGRWG